MAIVLRGKPLEVDTFIRPLLGGGRWLVGLAGGGLLSWLDLWWWVPAPLVLATAAMEGVLLFRADHAIALRLDDQKLVVDDRFSPTLTIRWLDVLATTVLYQRRGDGWEVVVVLGSDRRVLCSVAFQLSEPPDFGYDVEQVDAHLGAQAGILRATAPPGRAVRQRMHDADGLEQLLGFVRPPLGECDCLRLWSDEAATLSPFGHYTQPPSLYMLLTPGTWDLVHPEEGRIATGDCALTDWWVTTVEAVLLRVEGADEPALGVLPLLVLDLGEIQIAVPAPKLGGEHPRWRPPHPALTYTHAPEAVALITRLSTSWGPGMPPPWASDTPCSPGGPQG